jgi:hypothetical protein
VIIVYGNRWYGNAFARGGAGLATRCFHLYYVPLFPHEQMWVTERRGGRLFGFQTRWSWRAAMPQVAIQWGAAAAGIAGAAITPFAALPVIAGAIALWFWGHAGANPSGARDAKRRELSARVLGTGCPPELLPERVARALSSDLDESWAKASPDRSPEDVAQLGPRDQHEGALAFTIFAVRAQFERGERAATLRARAEQVLDAMEKAPSLPEGAPYRAELKLPETSA